MSLLEALFLLHHVSKFTGKPLHFLFHFASICFLEELRPTFSKPEDLLIQEIWATRWLSLSCHPPPNIWDGSKLAARFLFLPFCSRSPAPNFIAPRDYLWLILQHRLRKKWLKTYCFTSLLLVKNCPLQPCLMALRNEAVCGPSYLSGTKDVL